MWTPADRSLVGGFGSGQALTDDQFRLLEPLIPPAKSGGRPRSTDTRPPTAVYEACSRRGRLAGKDGRQVVAGTGRQDGMRSSSRLHSDPVCEVMGRVAVCDWDGRGS